MRLLPLTALFLLTPAARGDDAADARAVVEKAAKALGYKPGDPLPAMAWTEKGTFSGGGFKMEYTNAAAFHGPDKMRFDMAGEFGGMKLAFVIVANGDKAWEAMDGKSQEMTGDKLEYFRNEVYQVYTTSVLPLLSDKGFALATAGGKEVGGKKAVGVKVTRDKRPDVTLYFDPATHLPVKAEMKVKDEFQGWKEVLDEVYFEDWKDAGGRKAFGKFRVVRDGKPMIESVMTDRKEGVKLDPKLFEKP
ncbi:MAG: hypothetical protein C0501_00430 [Isosphaera sp.]|nr:hypothetical protein [Isosphaera sp.]